MDSHKEKERREWKGPFADEGWLYFDICIGVPRVPSYATADGAGLPT